MVLLADQAFAAEFSAAMSGGTIGWIVTLACYAGIIVAVVPWGNLAPTWVDPKKVVVNPTVKPVAPVSVDPTVTAFVDARAKKLEKRTALTTEIALIDAEIANDDAVINEAQS